MGSDFNQTDVNKRRSHVSDVAARLDLERLGARAIVVEAVPRPNTKKQSLGAHEPAEDIKAARVNLRDLRRMTRVGYDHFER